MSFLELVNRRLDYVKAYNSERHYTDHLYLAKRWVKLWGKLSCSDITGDMIQNYLLQRVRQTSGYTANKELRYLQGGFQLRHASSPKLDHLSNPTRGIQFFPVDKTVKYVPPKEDILRVMLAANPDVQDYLWTIALTMGRMSEVNRLTWQDVDLAGRYVMLYTRKKKGGNRTPRKVPMPDKLFDILSRRHCKPEEGRPWVFWHRYWNQDETRDGWSGLSRRESGS